MKIEVLRKKLELSQAGFAKEIGVPPSLISMIENGTRTPTFAVLQKCELKYPGKVTLADYSKN